MKNFIFIVVCVFCTLALQGKEPSPNQEHINFKPIAKTDFAPDPYTQLKKLHQTTASSGKTVPYPYTGIIATTGSDGKVRSRVIAISKITPEGIIFYTHNDSDKWEQMKKNPNASFTLFANHYVVTFNGPVELNPKGYPTTQHSLVINGEKQPSFEWGSFILKPEAVIYSRELYPHQSYAIVQTFIYTKGPNGKWVLSENPYYPTVEETNLVYRQ